MFQTADGYVDQAELAAFELDLENQLSSIQQTFVSGVYDLTSLRPIPRPKKIVEGKALSRQYFHVSVRDQVAWIAVVNALGPIIDEMMPPWSYGNRIYRAAWYEKTDEGSKLERGPYRHQSGHLYRKFQHSWPLFRRHVSLTARAMARRSNAPLSQDLDEGDQNALASARTEKLAYLSSGYWPETPNAKGTKIYYAGIDLEKFYPRLKRSAVASGLLTAIGEDAKDERLVRLLKSLLDFDVNFEGIPPQLLNNVEPSFSPEDTAGIPTGLFVSGFLANAAMLGVDLDIKEKLKNDRTVAHFRFVDDHVILAYSFDGLCKWISDYQMILAEKSIGAVINNEKYDPESLSRFILDSERSETDKTELQKLRAAAIADTEIDGENPTKLLTKTLAQVSEIAHTNSDLMDDDDLKERLKLLEWLLLADIPEREIRPDTRAAFAAGQIAATVPALVQEGDGLLADARALSVLQRSQKATETADVREKETALRRKMQKHRQFEKAYLRKYFLLLLQSFKEFPTKARLYYRLHQYCQITGYAGVGEIRNWISSLRDNGNPKWADYYAGLSHQILSNTSLKAARTLTRPASLRSDKLAALNHLTDISNIDLRSHIVPPNRRSWYHETAQRELAVSLLAAATELEVNDAQKGLVGRLKRKAVKLMDSISTDWANLSPSLGVWAHRVENTLSLGGAPSEAWLHLFSPDFVPGVAADLKSQRRYPEHYSDPAWQHELEKQEEPDISDSGWYREMLQSAPERVSAALSSGKAAMARAASSLQAAEDGWVTAGEWASFTADLSPFDPRVSEWTALEITQQLVSLTKEMGTDTASLDRIHEYNVLINASLKTPKVQGTLGWQTWRDTIRGEHAVKYRNSETSVVDYRYYYYDGGTLQPDIWGRRLTAIGRFLLGLLQHKFESPRSWNIRGLERVNPIVKRNLLQSLAISSPTLLILNECLSGRSAENREIVANSSLFNWDEGEETNDTEYDPPPLLGPGPLLQALEKAQSVLEQNQLAVSLNQPRQLIPFRLSDFSAGAEHNNEEDQENG